MNHAILAVSIGASCSYILYTNFSQVKCERNIRVEVDIVEKHKKIRDDLPFYTEEEISHHNNKYHFMKTPGVDTFDIIGNAWEIQRYNYIEIRKCQRLIIKYLIRFNFDKYYLIENLVFGFLMELEFMILRK